MVPISGPSCRTGLLLIFMLCTFTLVVLGEVVTGELIFLERIRGSPKLLGVSGGAQDEPLKVIDQQVVQSRGTSGGAIVQRLEEFFDHDEVHLTAILIFFFISLSFTSSKSLRRLILLFLFSLY